MTRAKKKTDATTTLPQANVKRRRWRLPAVWIVPMVAAVIAGFIVYSQIDEFGPTITITFKDGDGLKPAKTAIQYRGVRIGEVTSVALSDDLRNVLVRVRLQRSATSIASEGSVFWVVRLGGGIENITGLGTVIAGPHIEVLPGSGKLKLQFVGLEGSPESSESNGLRLILISDHLGSLKPGSPVYYRGLEVGVVQACLLGAKANTVDIHVLIRQRYARLVRDGSMFWNASGTDVKFGLFSGLEVNVQSLKSLVAGGVAFATPNDSKARAAAGGATFRLYDDPKKEWLAWAPEIPMSQEK